MWCNNSEKKAFESRDFSITLIREDDGETTIYQLRSSMVSLRAVGDDKPVFTVKRTTIDNQNQLVLVTWAVDENGKLKTDCRPNDIDNDTLTYGFLP